MADRHQWAAGRRRYPSPIRQRQAEETRRRILDAARLLFREAGYAGTTLDAIAAAAGVSPKTVAAFGSKRGLLAALVDPVASGRRFQELLGDLRAATDLRRRVELAARLTRQVYVAWAPEFDLLRGAGAMAPELAEVARQVGARRRQNQTRLIAYLDDQGVLRGGLAPEQATDVLWALTGYDLCRTLVVACGWAPERYEAWLDRRGELLLLLAQQVVWVSLHAVDREVGHDCPFRYVPQAMVPERLSPCAPAWNHPTHGA